MIYSQIAEVEAPLDRDLYQADKGLKNTEFVIRDGGVILLDAECHNGVVRPHVNAHQRKLVHCCLRGCLTVIRMLITGHHALCRAYARGQNI
eukprot:SAG31_NODE_20515_length_572_cov_0.983087_2_plen_92_part_00